MSFTRKAERRNYRVVVLGSTGVGKTAIISQFLYTKFPENYKETIEELHRHIVKFEAMAVEIDILDMCGSYEFPAMRRLAINTGDAFLLVYSIDNAESFENVKRLMEEIKDCKQEKDFFVLVIANKTDLTGKQSYDQAVKESIACLEWEEQCFKTSAKTGENIERVFQTLEEKIKEKVISEGKKQPHQRRFSIPVMKKSKHRHEKASSPKLKSRSYSAD